MTQVALIGVGNVGRSWAVVFARAGCRVALWDAVDAAVPTAMPLIAAALADMGPAPGVADPMALIRPAASLADALDGVDYVQESAVEQLEAKKALFAQMDALAPPGAIIASSTSAIPGSAFCEGLTGAARCLVAHPVNPPHVIPLVELCATPWTSAATIERARALMTQVGQSPVVLNREVDGFLLNRLQWALMGEAMHLVGEGYCSPEDIDRVLTDGLALRWAFIGPFQVAHLNSTAGVQGYYSGLSQAISRVQSSLQTDYPPRQDVVDRIHAGLAETIPVPAIPDRQKWRDRRIQALRRHLAGEKTG